MIKLKPAGILLAALLMAGCVSTPTKTLTGDEPLTVAEFTKATGSVKLTGVKQVAIPSFFVQFVRDQTLELKGGLGFESYTTQVRGIDPEALQGMADALYDGFVAELKAAGIEVIPTATLDANADFQDLRKSARQSPYTEEAATGGTKRDDKLQGVSLLVSARKLPINVRYVIDKKWLVGDAADGFKMTLAMAPVKISNTLNVPLIDVRMTVAMASPKGSVSSYGSRYSYSQSDDFKFKPEFFPRFVEAGTLATVIKNGNGTYSLSQPVIIKDVGFSVAQGAGGGARGSGLLGALGRAIGGQAKSDADVYIDVKAEDAGARITSRGREVAKLLVEAMTK
jgi:hypothetical protein